MSTVARGVFFVHVMKTGGNSLSARLRSWYPDETVYPDREADDEPFAKTTVDTLLRLRQAEGRPRRFYSVHMPAWVADVVAPDHLRVTALREPVARTISHLRHIAGLCRDFASLDDIYEHPDWHERLVNYQVRIFSTTRSEEAQEQERLGELIGGTADVPRGFLLPVLTTGIRACPPIGDDALERAVATLDRYDVVGVTEHLDRVLDRLARELGQARRPVGHHNRGSVSLSASDALLARIRAENALDVELYEHVRRGVAAN